jgi:hypothetical protein
MSFRNEKTLKEAAGVGNKTGLVSLNIKQRAEVVTVYTMLLNNGLLLYSANVIASTSRRRTNTAITKERFGTCRVRSISMAKFTAVRR